MKFLSICVSIILYVENLRLSVVKFQLLAYFGFLTHDVACLSLIHISEPTRPY